MHVREILIFIENHTVLVVIWSCLLIMVSYTTIVSYIRKLFEISCDEAILLMNKKSAVIIDIRAKNEYDLGHIINSINIPWDTKNKHDLFLNKKFKNNPVIIVHDNQSSYSIKQYCSKIGLIQVYVLEGGISGWKSHDLPISLRK